MSFMSPCYKNILLTLLKFFDLSELQMLDPHAIEVLPIKILAFRNKKLRNREINECLVQSDKYSKSSSTWEDAATMKRQFPYLFI